MIRRFFEIARRNGWRRGVMAGGLLWLVLALGACVTHTALEREYARKPRNADGVVTVAVARVIDPPAAWFATHPECQGRAPAAVLLIHGFVGSPTEYADLGEHLAAQGYHVRLMRLPGHGTTPQDFARQTTATLLNAVRTEYAALRRDYPSVAVGGFSMGGALATLLAAETDADRLILFAPYFGVTYRWFYVLPVEKWNALLRPMVPYVPKSERFVQVNRRESVPHIYSYRVVPTKGAATLIELGKRARDPRVVAQVKCPVLLVASEGDRAASPARMQQVFAQFSNPAKHAVWLNSRNNHDIFWDWDAADAKRAAVDFMGPAAQPKPARVAAGLL
jgi:esterase/lipase